MQDNEFESPAPPPRSPRQQKFWPIAAAIFLVIALITAYFVWFRGDAPPPPPPVAEAPAAETPAPVASEPLPEEPPLPPLDASDTAVRELAASLSAHPRLVAWLANDDLARRLVVSVTNVAEGVNPRKHVPFLEPRSDFGVAQRQGRVVVDPTSYERFETMVTVFESLDTQGVAELYRRLEPLFEQAHSDLGYPDESFRATLLTAIRRLLEVPRPTGDVVLEPAVSSYKYADPQLEALSGAGKQLLRTGPRNVARVQAKLVEIGLALGFTPAELRG